MVDPAYTRGDFRGLLSYIRNLKLRHATFTVMTPLPGTELYASREGELLSRKPEMYDMLHALLPTTLPLPDFYDEMAGLWQRAVPFHRSLPLLWKFGLRGMMLRIRVFSAFLQKVRASHRDYDVASAGGD